MLFSPQERLRMELRMQEMPRMSGGTADPQGREGVVSCNPMQTPKKQQEDGEGGSSPTQGSGKMRGKL